MCFGSDNADRLQGPGSPFGTICKDQGLLAGSPERSQISLPNFVTHSTTKIVPIGSKVANEVKNPNRLILSHYKILSHCLQLFDKFAGALYN